MLKIQRILPLPWKSLRSENPSGSDIFPLTEDASAREQTAEAEGRANLLFVSARNRRVNDITACPLCPADNSFRLVAEKPRNFRFPVPCSSLHKSEINHF
jgi:hypothetical protein